MFTDGSSFVEQGERKAGYAVVTLHDTLEAQSLPPGTSAQLAELIALTRALELGKQQRINIYTDSKYAYLILHAHAAIWKERGFQTTGGTAIKNYKQILKLLEAVHLPKEVAVIHCPGHQKGIDEITEGNRRADQQAKEAAKGTLQQMTTLAPLIWTGPPPEIKPQYTQEETQQALSKGGNLLPSGWIQMEDNKLYLPANSQWKILHTLHQSSHLGEENTFKLTQEIFEGIRISKTIQQIVKTCEMYQRNSPLNYAKKFPRLQRTGQFPGEDWHPDFTHIPKSNGFQYLMFMEDTFTGCTEACPS